MNENLKFKNHTCKCQMCAVKIQLSDQILPACITALKTLHDLPSYYEFYSTNYVIQHFDSNIQPWRMIIVVVSILIVVFTISGNSLICIAALLDHHLRHRSNVLFVSLSVTNLLFACIAMTFNVTYNIVNPTKFTDMTVTLFLSLDKCFCTTTILHLVAIAFDRFIHIQAPLKYSRKLTPRLLVVIIVSLWFTSALITFLPIQLSWHKEDPKNYLNHKTFKIEIQNYTDGLKTQPRNNLTCYHKVDRGYAFTNALLSFFIPLMLMIFIYTRLFLLTKQHISQINSCHQTIVVQDSLADCRRYKSFQALETTLTPCLESNRNQRKSLSSLKAAFYLEPGDDFLTINSHNKPTSISTSLNISADTLKLRPRLSKSTVSSCRSVEVSKPDSLLSTKTNGTNCSVTCVRTQRMHSLPGIRVSIRRPQTARGLERLQSLGSDRQLQKAHKAAITLGVILGSFTVCWLPYFIINCVASLCDCIPKETIFAVTWLGYFNACLNPVVYTLLNNKFRQSCKKLLCAWRYNRERKVQYGLDKLRHFGDATIHLAIGKVPWNKELKPANTNGFPS